MNVPSKFKNRMSNTKNGDILFWMYTGAEGGQKIIQQMTKDLVTQSATAIANRTMQRRGDKCDSLRIETEIGLPNRLGGTRIVAKVVGGAYTDQHIRYMTRESLQKSIDAGRV